MTDLESVLEELTKNLLDVEPQFVVLSNYTEGSKDGAGLPVIYVPSAHLESLTEDRII
ncbi:hypothetical protein [Vibrio sp. F13]|uniref:hypothetical protein n=1 Tax=Vibrio sp. F13 TaxID=2070777 RepID=UPI0014835ED4|nr:hypothetical protein [Vibrio sp. F13]